MSKRWTFKDDMFLACHFEAVGDYIGEHDLGRPKGAATKRVAKLKECGAWQVLKLHSLNMLAYRVALDLPLLVDNEEYELGQRVAAHSKAFFDDSKAA